jgi:photosystem II stability/assembly factor-like uncharacterized protein
LLFLKMQYKKSIISYIILLFSLQGYGQQVKKKYSWQHLGPKTIPPSNVDSLQWTSTGTGWIEDVLIEPDCWYAGSITGGLYRSTNNGQSWKKVDKDSHLQMGTLCIAKKGNILFRGTGLTHYNEDFGFGVLKSENDGKSWSQTGLQFLSTEKKPTWALAVSPNDSNMVACTPNAIYHSNNLGETWKEVFSDEKIDFRTAIFSNYKLNLCFASGNRLYKSLDAGKNWEDITQRLGIYNPKVATKINYKFERIAFCEDPNIQGRYLAFYSYGKQTYIDESLDFGESWENIYTSYAISRIDIHHAEIAIAPGNSDIIVLGGVRAYVSKNGGATFSQVTFPFYLDNRFAHDDIRGMQLFSPNEFFLATDGGLFRTTDTGATWQNVSGKNLTMMQIYGLAELKNGEIMLGCQDLGTFKVRKKQWLNVGILYGDGGDVLELDNDYLTLSGGAIRKMEKGNLLSSTFVHPPATVNPFTGKLVRIPKYQTDSFYYVGKDVWLNNGEQWQNLTSTLKSGQFKATGFNINKANTQSVYLAFDQPTWDPSNLRNKFYKSENGGQDWQDISRTLPVLAWRHITCITSNPSDENEVYLGLGTMDDGEIHKVYKSNDGGETWTNYSEGLAPYETFKMYHFTNSNGVLIATLDGLYYRNSSMPSWQKLKGKIPPIAIRDFEVNEEDRFIYAGTYGNGLWRMKIPRKMLRY